MEGKSSVFPVVDVGWREETATAAPEAVEDVAVEVSLVKLEVDDWRS